MIGFVWQVTRGKNCSGIPMPKTQIKVIKPSNIINHPTVCLPGWSLHWINTGWAFAGQGVCLSGKLGFYLTWRWASTRCCDWAKEIAAHLALQRTSSWGCLWWDYFVTTWLNWRTHICLGSEGITLGRLGRTSNSVHNIDVKVHQANVFYYDPID